MSNHRSITQIPKSFLFQSYFDSTLLQNAILAQPAGSSFVENTRETAQVAGIGFALHPSSECPVAIRARGGGSDTAPIVLVPGSQKIVGGFDEFEWGLPFGWLGGGRALLYVIHRKDASLDFGSAAPPPLIFHRTRLVIENIAAAPGTARQNWPNAFPWANAKSGASASPQGSGALVTVTPDVALCRLRATLAAPATLTFVLHSTEDFDEDSTGAYGADLTAFDVQFPQVAGAPIAAFPLGMITAEQHGISMQDSGGVNVLSDDPNLIGKYLDVVRYGRIS